MRPLAGVGRVLRGKNQALGLWRGKPRKRHGQAAKARPAWLGGPGPFGFRLVAGSWELGAGGWGLGAGGWRRLFRQAACKLPISSATVCAASRSCSENRPDFAPALIAAKSLKPCDGGVFRGSFFAPVFAVAKAGADRVLKTKKARRGAGLSGQRCRAL